MKAGTGRPPPLSCFRGCERVRGRRQAASVPESSTPDTDDAPGARGLATTHASRHGGNPGARDLLNGSQDCYECPPGRRVQPQALPSAADSQTQFWRGSSLSGAHEGSELLGVRADETHPGEQSRPGGGGQAGGGWAPPVLGGTRRAAGRPGTAERPLLRASARMAGGRARTGSQSPRASKCTYRARCTVQGGADPLTGGADSRSRPSHTVGLAFHGSFRGRGQVSMGLFHK